MPGIYALLRFAGPPVTGDDLIAGLARHPDRPPASWWLEPGSAPRVGLAARAWIERAARPDAAQVVTADDGTLTVAADARIDNRPELTSRLGRTMGETAAWPDARFILEAYRAWGPAGIERLIGDFAFLLWDQAHRRLVACRDGLGQRTLYLHRTPQRIAFANSLDRLLALPDVRPRLDEQKLADSLVLYQNPDHTFIEGIHRVPSGHLMTAEPDGVTVKRYWSPRPPGELRLGSDREYLDGFLKVFHEAVRNHVAGPDPIAIMLSGGLDSASVAAVAARELAEQGRRLQAFHAAPRSDYAGPSRRGWVTDESADVAAIAERHRNLDLEVVRPDGATMLADLDRSFPMTHAPPRNPANITWFDEIYRLASARGAGVLLVGHAGNATISYGGLRTLRQWARQGEWGHLWREVRAHARLTSQPALRVLRDQILRPYGNRIRAALKPGGNGVDAPVWETTLSPIRPEFATAMGAADRVASARRDARTLEHASDLEIRLTVLTGPADGPDVYGAFREHYGVDTRDPTADPRVVGYTLSVPPQQLLRGGMTRALIRRAMDGYLPDQVRLRRTRGAQSGDWLQWLPTLRGDCQRELALLAANDTARRCLDLERLTSLVDRWPDTLTLAHEAEYKLRLLRGVATGRFIRWFEARYQ
ncbi:MAG: asparagine synthetase B family protein [Gemmatimonadales bacterium]